MLDSADSKKLATSDTIFTGKGSILGFLLGTDGANDPAITIYDGIDNTGTEIVPTNTYDASALGLNGAMFGFKKKCQTGCYVEITCGGTVEVIIDFKQPG